MQFIHANCQNILVSNQNPIFKDGNSELFNFISKNLKIPESYLNANITGKLLVKFRVKSNGRIDKFEILKSPGFGIDNEIIRVLKLTSNKWIPAKRNGKTINDFIILSINIDYE